LDHKEELDEQNRSIAELREDIARQKKEELFTRCYLFLSKDRQFEAVTQINSHKSQNSYDSRSLVLLEWGQVQERSSERLLRML